MGSEKVRTFALHLRNMVSLAQLVRASDCGSEGRGFDPHTSPHPEEMATPFPFFYYYLIDCILCSNTQMT